MTPNIFQEFIRLAGYRGALKRFADAGIVRGAAASVAPVGMEFMEYYRRSIVEMPIYTFKTSFVNFVNLITGIEEDRKSTALHSLYTTVASMVALIDFKVLREEATKVLKSITIDSIDHQALLNETTEADIKGNVELYLFVYTLFLDEIQAEIISYQDRNPALGKFPEIPPDLIEALRKEARNGV